MQLTDAGQATFQTAGIESTSVLTRTIELVTDGNGFFQHDDLLEGRYIISATATIGGIPRRLRSETQVVTDENTVTQLRLLTGLESQRRLVISGTLTIGGALIGTFPIYEGVMLSPEERTRRLTLVRCQDDKVQIVIDVQLQLQEDDRSISVAGKAQLGRGTTCVTADQQDAATFGATLSENATDAAGIVLSNRFAGGSDTAQIDLTFHNGQQTPTAAAPMGLQRGGRLVTPDEAIDLVFPRRSAGPPVTVTYARRTLSPVTPQPTCKEGIACIFRLVQQFTLDATASDGTAVTQFSEPYHLSMHYSEALLRGEGVDPTTLQPLYYNGSQWLEVFPCTGCGIDTAKGVVTVLLDHFTEFALVGTVSEPPATSTAIYLPLVMR